MILQCELSANTQLSLLYEFYIQQNSKKPGTVYATYLLSGTLAHVDVPNIKEVSQGDNNDPSPSSPFMNSTMPIEDDSRAYALPNVISIVGEQDLEGNSSTQDIISSLTLTSCQRKL